MLQHFRGHHVLSDNGRHASIMVVIMIVGFTLRGFQVDVVHLSIHPLLMSVDL